MFSESPQKAALFFFLTTLLLPGLCSEAMASSFCKIYLKDGRVVEASSCWEEEGTVCYEKFGGVIRLPADNVKRMEVVEPEPKPKASAPSSLKTADSRGEEGSFVQEVRIERKRHFSYFDFLSDDRLKDIDETLDFDEQYLYIREKMDRQLRTVNDKENRYRRMNEQKGDGRLVRAIGHYMKWVSAFNKFTERRLLMEGTETPLDFALTDEIERLSNLRDELIQEEHDYVSRTLAEIKDEIRALQGKIRDDEVKSLEEWDLVAEERNEWCKAQREAGARNCSSRWTGKKMQTVSIAEKKRKVTEMERRIPRLEKQLREVLEDMGS